MPVELLYKSTSGSTDSSTKLPRGLVIVWPTSTGPQPRIGKDNIARTSDDGGVLVAATLFSSIEPQEDELDVLQASEQGVAGSTMVGVAVAMFVVGGVLGALAAVAFPRLAGKGGMGGGRGGSAFESVMNVPMLRGSKHLSGSVGYDPLDRDVRGAGAV